MASIVIRNLDETTKQRLRIRAARHNTSMEEEARGILRTALAMDESEDLSEGLGTSIWKLFAPLGGVDLELPPREMGPEPPDFSE